LSMECTAHCDQIYRIVISPEEQEQWNPVRQRVKHFNREAVAAYSRGRQSRTPVSAHEMKLGRSREPRSGGSDSRLLSPLRGSGADGYSDLRVYTAAICCRRYAAKMLHSGSIYDCSLNAQSVRLRTSKSADSCSLLGG
jgi:hypothetical protein